MRALLLLAAVSACWTGASPEPAPIIAPPEPARATPYLRVRLERTVCLADCSAFTIEIDGTRRIARWTSNDDGEAAARSTRVSAADLRALDREIVATQFFDRDEKGNLPIKPTCTNDGTTTTCSIGGTLSICSDPQHAVLTVSRGIRSHRVEYDFCKDNPEILGLARLVERLARVRPPNE